MKPTLTTERVQAALRREGSATTSTIAAGLGERVPGVHGVLHRGVTEGWCRVVGKDGNADVYAWAVIDAAPAIKIRPDAQFAAELAERIERISDRAIPEKQCACGRVFQIEGGDRCLSCAMRWGSR